MKEDGSLELPETKSRSIYYPVYLHFKFYNMFRHSVPRFIACQCGLRAHLCVTPKSFLSDQDASYSQSRIITTLQERPSDEKHIGWHDWNYQDQLSSLQSTPTPHATIAARSQQDDKVGGPNSLDGFKIIPAKRAIAQYFNNLLYYPCSAWAAVAYDLALEPKAQGSCDDHDWSMHFSTPGSTGIFSPSF